MSGMLAAIEAQSAWVAAGIHAQQLLLQRLEAQTGCYSLPLPAPYTHRCAYCRTFDSAPTRCPSCGAPR